MQFDLFNQPNELDLALGTNSKKKDKKSQDEELAKTVVRQNALLSISNMSLEEINVWLDKPLMVLGFKRPWKVYLEDRKLFYDWFQKIRNIPRDHHTRKRNVPDYLLR